MWHRLFDQFLKKLMKEKNCLSKASTVTARSVLKYVRKVSAGAILVLVPQDHFGIISRGTPIRRRRGRIP
jgi:hypothetical protein